MRWLPGTEILTCVVATRATDYFCRGPPRRCGSPRDHRPPALASSARGPAVVARLARIGRRRLGLVRVAGDARWWVLGAARAVGCRGARRRRGPPAVPRAVVAPAGRGGDQPARPARRPG